MARFPYVLPRHPDMGRGLICLAHLNEWERKNLPFLQTASGRDLYFSLVRRWLLRHESNDSLLKTFVIRLTDRAMRNRIRNFEEIGLITCTQMGSDARARTIQPTQKMLETFESHTLELRKIFREHFFYIKK